MFTHEKFLEEYADILPVTVTDENFSQQLDMCYSAVTNWLIQYDDSKHI